MKTSALAKIVESVCVKATSLVAVWDRLIDTATSSEAWGLLLRTSDDEHDEVVADWIAKAVAATIENA